MEIVKAYMKQYPEDQVVVIKGGYAAYLILKQYGVDIEVKDLDVNIFSSRTREDVCQSFEALLPSIYSVSGEVRIFEYSDRAAQGIDIDLFINEEYITQIETIEGVQVESLERLIGSYYAFLKGNKRNIEFLKDIKPFGRNELDKMKTKHNRVLARFRSLVECHQKRLESKTQTN